MAKRHKHSAEHYARLRYKSWRSQPAFQNLDEFLILTEPPEPEPGQAAPPAGEPAGEEATDTKKKPRCTKAQKLARLDAIATMLEKNVPMLSIVALAKKNFGLRRRSVQLYVREVKKRWAEAAQKEDYVAHLWKSNLQYEACSHELFRTLQGTDDPKVKANLLRVNLGYMKARDECMGVLQLHRRKAKRDQSPDSFRERNQRDRMVVMPLGELLERVDNMRYAWQMEFHQEFMKLNGLEPMKSVFVDGQWVYPQGPNPPQAVMPPVPKCPPPGWGEEWQRRAEAQAKEELKKELGFKE